MQDRVLWSPWHGCHKCSPGCRNCYVYYLDSLHGVDSNKVTRSKTQFDLPLKKDRKGAYKIPSNAQVATCFTSDFFIEEADEWRAEAWNIIKSRPDVQFLICTKRIERIQSCLPAGWGNGWENVIIAVTCETQKMADSRLPIMLSIKARHKYIFVAPILEQVILDEYLASNQFELVSVGGESYPNARICDFDWVKRIKQSCDQYHVEFDFHQTGSHFVMNGVHYHINHREEYAQAKKGMRVLEREKGHSDNK